MNSLIFPNGCLPSVEVIARNVARHGDLRMVDLEDITPHYAETLRRWRANVEAHARAAGGAGLRRALPAAVDAVPELLRGGLHRAPDRERPGRARQAPLARPPGHRRSARPAVRRHGGARVKAAAIAVLGLRVAYGAALLVAPDKVTQVAGSARARRSDPGRAAGARRARGAPARLRDRRGAARAAAARHGSWRQHRRRPERHRRDLRGPRRAARRRGAEDRRGRGRLGRAHRPCSRPA